MHGGDKFDNGASADADSYLDTDSEHVDKRARFMTYVYVCCIKLWLTYA